jgi:tRNA A-37 threonylcarbamoyl transferase component Bud32
MSPEHPANSNRQLQMGKFRILERIATGGMGAVYKARDSESDRIVALKILSPELATKPRMIERFRLEALHGRKLRHPNVVTLYESGEINGIHYLALEFVEGIDLQAYILQKGQLDIDQSRLIIIQATQAIAHLHQQGVIHRDIKPSNFLIRYKDGQPLIKLIDLGLARHRDDDEECRVTRAGSTVGTVDYIAPEQARNSGSADVRSDIYSLGCTWYHMLTGQPPFTEGSLLERLYQHVEADPPDIRTLNPEVPELVVKIIKRMMAKEPSERYQTPAGLLRELQGTDPNVQPFSKRVLAGLAQDDQASAERVERSRRGSRVRGTPILGASKRKLSAARLAAVIVALVGFVLLGMLVIRAALRPSPPAADPSPDVPGPAAEPLPPLPGPQTTKSGPRPPPATAKRPEVVPPKIEASTPRLPKLYEPLVPINVAELSQEWERPWHQTAPVAAGPTFRVSRSSRRGQGQTFDSLAAACAAAPANQETVIEIHANGPLFEGPVTVSGRSLVVRAGKGYRPLLAWDAKRAAAGAAEHFISLSGGRLTLENLDIVCQATAQGQSEPAAMLRIANGDLTAQSCTFSVAGKHSAGVAVVRLEARGASDAGKCRFSQCYLRGAEVIAVDVRAPGADVLLDGCLAVGGARALLQVRGFNPLTPPTVRVRRSTLVAGRSLLSLEPSTSTSMGPALRFLGWDALLARSGSQTEEALVVVRDRVNPHEIQWQAINCLYAGWRTLLKAPALAINSLPAWRDHTHQSEGEALTTRPWPAVGPSQPAEIRAADYRTAGSEVCYAATTGPGPLGCDLAALPPTHANWLRVTYNPFLPAQVDLPQTGVMRPIPPATDNRYHGEQLDLAQIGDLGQYLQNIQKTHALGPRVVLHLTGAGEHRTSPIAWKDASLVLCFQAPKEDAEPLVLVPNGATVADHEALIEILNGHLEISGGTIRFADRTLLPRYMVRVRGGDLSLAGCRLEGPLASSPENYRGLISFEGAENHGGRTNGCALADSVLISARTLLHLANPGVRLRMENCLGLANGDALELDLGGADQPRLEVQGALRHNTLAVKRAVIHLKDAPAVQAMVEPILMQAIANVFMDPFAGPSSQAGVLLYEGDALNGGLLVWQGQGNLYDKRFLFYTQPEGEAFPDKPQAYPTWTQLWGTIGDRQPVADVGLAHPLVLGKAPPLSQLALPPLFKKPLPGADFGRLGLVNKRQK